MTSPAADREYFRHKATFYRGTVKVDLRHLKFEDPKRDGVRTISQKNVERLIEVFRLEGCMRLEPEHHVPALIPQEILEDSLRNSGLEQEEIMEYAIPKHLHLAESVRLTVLHGQHRLLAAKQFLWDKWWVVDLYSDNIPSLAVSRMREDQANSQPFADGDIYRNIRQHLRYNRDEEAAKWLARLSPGKRKRVEQLRKNTLLKNAFDRLLPFRGLWPAMQLGCLNRLLPLKCQEEFVHYLDRISNQLLYIFNGENSKFLNHDTIERLQTLTPNYSTHDAAKIRKMMQEGAIFPDIRSQEARNSILSRLLSIDGRILSLYTFFQDTIYFRDCHRILRQLLPPTFTTTREEFYRCYSSSSQSIGLKVQVDEGTFVYYNGDTMLQRELSYKQLFLAAMRYCPISDKKFRKPKAEGQLLEGLDEEHWYRISRLALDLGFSNDEIHKLVNEATDDLDEKMALDLLYTYRPPELYIIDNDRLKELARFMAPEIRRSAIRRLRQHSPEFTTDLEMQPLVERCNGPSDACYQKEREFLFLDIISNYNPAPKAHLTSLGIRRDIFVSFFGDTILPSQISNDGDIPGDSDEEAQACGSVGTVNDVRSEEAPAENDLAVDSDEEAQACGSVGTVNNLRSEEAPAENDLAVDSRDAGAVAKLFEPDVFVRDSEDDSREMNQFHTLPLNQKPSEAVKEFLSDSVIVIYQWDKRRYAKFSDTFDQKAVFEQVVCSLADNHNGFFTFKEGRAVMHGLGSLWATARQTKLVLAGPKFDPESGAGLNLQRGTRDDILSWVDNS
ncbi:hypothetical protein TMEN_6613 [Trichophyton mentagrophytes]|nr:hypothetical protein TMEN_6613 [Trichophyton mentagrophytes]